MKNKEKALTKLEEDIEKARGNFWRELTTFINLIKQEQKFQDTYQFIKLIDKVEILLPKSATESERVLMAHAVDIYKRKLKKELSKWKSHNILREV